MQRDERNLPEVLEDEFKFSENTVEKTGGLGFSPVLLAPGRRNEDQRCQVDYDSQPD